MGLLDSQIVALNVDTTPETPQLIELQIDGQRRTLNLAPHSVRSAGYKIHAQIEDGSLVEIAPGPVRTIRGEVLEIPGSVVAGSVLEHGLEALILLPDGERMWIEPIAPRVAGAQADQHVVYRAADIVHPAGSCGVTEAWLKQNPPAWNPAQAGEGGVAGGATTCAEVACDADFEFYQDYGSSVTNVENRINLVINTVNTQYTTQCDIRHVISQIIVRTSEPDPYSSTSAGTLLGQFQSHWNANHDSVQRDVAHLFTGKSLVGGTIGIAFLSAVCDLAGAYSLVESDCCGSLGCASDLTAHELGHNWSATHCSCPSFTMNPSITCANNFSLGSIDEIVAYRNAAPCVDPCEDSTTTLPFADNFPTTTIDTSLWTGIDGATINTSGNGEPSAPNSLNLDGSLNGGDELRSAIMNAAGLFSLTISYYFERTGTQNSPETNDDLFVEYLTSAGDWIELHRQLGSGPDMASYQQVTAEFPAAALHAGFRFRFRVASNELGADDWFVDNVSVTGIVVPANNTCSSAQGIVAGAYAFNTLGATTDGPNETAQCNFNGFTQIDKDIWYLFFAQCTGTMTASLCNSSFNSKLALYGSACPGGSGLTLGCNDAFCGDDGQITINVVQNQVVRIRVGGANNSAGSGTLVVSCTPGNTCPADIAPPGGNGNVDVGDLLAVVAAWGLCPNPSNCPADIAPPGGNDVVDVSDLLAVVAAWGSCP